MHPRAIILTDPVMTVLTFQRLKNNKINFSFSDLVVVAVAVTVATASDCGVADSDPI